MRWISHREDQLNERAKDFEKAMDKLRSEFDKRESYAETKPQMQEVLDVARDINGVMLRRNLRKMSKKNGLPCEEN